MENTCLSKKIIKPLNAKDKVSGHILRIFTFVKNSKIK